MATSQGKSFVECLGDGATTTFSVPFPYLSPEHVEVLVDDVAVAYNFLTTNSLEVTPAPADQSTVRIRRQTPDDPLVDFSQGNQFSRTKLLTAYQQILYVAQEAFDEGTTITVDVSASFAEITNQITTNTAALQAQIDAYTAQFDTDIQAADADFAAQIAALQDFPADLQQLLDDLDAAYTALQTDVDQLEIDTAAAEADIAALQTFSLPTPEVSASGGGNTISGLDYDEPATFDELVLLDKPHTFIGLGESGFPFTNLGTGLSTVTGGQVSQFQSTGLLNLPGSSMTLAGGNAGAYFGTLQADDPLYSPGTSFTAFLWARLDDLNEPTEVRNTLISTIQGGGWGLEVTDDDSDDVLDTLSFIARTQAGAYERCEVTLASAGITAGVPFGVVVRYNNPTMEIFVNGSLAATFQASPDQGYIHPATVQGFFLGGDLSSTPTAVDSDTGIDGALDTFIFYCHSVSNERIARIHQAAVDGVVPIPNPDGIYAFTTTPVTNQSPVDAAPAEPTSTELTIETPNVEDGTHVATRWEVATDAGFTNVIHDVTSESDLTTHVFDGDPLTEYHWRASLVVEITTASGASTSYTTSLPAGIFTTDPADYTSDVNAVAVSDDPDKTCRVMYYTGDDTQALVFGSRRTSSVESFMFINKANANVTGYFNGQENADFMSMTRAVEISPDVLIVVNRNTSTGNYRFYTIDKSVDDKAPVITDRGSVTIGDNGSSDFTTHGDIDSNGNFVVTAQTATNTVVARIFDISDLSSISSLASVTITPGDTIIAHGYAHGKVWVARRNSTTVTYADVNASSFSTTATSPHGVSTTITPGGGYREVGEVVPMADGDTVAILAKGVSGGSFVGVVSSISASNPSNAGATINLAANATSLISTNLNARDSQGSMPHYTARGDVLMYTENDTDDAQYMFINPFSYEWGCYSLPNNNGGGSYYSPHLISAVFDDFTSVFFVGDNSSTAHYYRINYTP